jgi:Phage tail tube protein
MARARGSNALLNAAFESTYGTVPGSGYFKLPFSSSEIGEEQKLIDNDLLGLGREAQAPSYDVIDNEGNVNVPVDLRNFGFWLKALLGSPTSADAVAASGKFTFTAQPVANATLTIAGQTWTFVAAAPAANQTQIGANLAATLTALATNLNASVVSQIAAATYTATATELTIVHKTIGLIGNSFGLVASTAPASNATAPRPTLTGGARTHTFSSGSLILPSLSLEVGMPEAPAFSTNYGGVANTLQIQLQRSGLLGAQIGIIAQGETPIVAASTAGSPTEFITERFSQFQGNIKRNGVDLANVVSADVNYSNMMEKVEVIRSDGRIAGVDPGVVMAKGNLTARFADTTLIDQATSRQPCAISYGWSSDASRSLIFSFPSVYLPRPKRAVSGPNGIQMPFAWQAAKDPVTGKTMTVVLTNDVTTY